MTSEARNEGKIMLECVVDIVALMFLLHFGVLRPSLVSIMRICELNWMVGVIVGVSDF